MKIANSRQQTANSSTSAVRTLNMTHLTSVFFLSFPSLAAIDRAKLTRSCWQHPDGRRGETGCVGMERGRGKMMISCISESVESPDMYCRISNVPCIAFRTDI
jgi:hypothetical protein